MKLLDLFPEELKKQVSREVSGIKKERVKDIDYAFSRARKLPLISQRNILSAMTHFYNVKNVTDAERIDAYKKILERAEIFKICTMGFIEQCKGLFKD
jgi:hypothetical protein